MQIQKEEIRMQITDAALDEFSVHGYKKVTMKNIAQKAGITAGNIYAYFPSKEALLKCLLEDAVKTLKEVIYDTITPGILPLNIEEYSHNLVEKYMQIRKPFLIIINGCEGSNFENIKSSLIELACQRIIAAFPDKFSGIAAEAVVVALINGIIYIFIQCNHDFELFSLTLTKYLEFMIGNLFSGN